MSNFILEIGGEEIPARFLKNEEQELAELFARALDENGLKHGELKTFSTPRRLALIVRDVAPTRDVSEELIMGPPTRVAYDEKGDPTKAALGFAKTNGVDPGDLIRVATPKGEYLAVKKIKGGEDAAMVLARIAPAVAASLSFPKSMRWGDYSLVYARPVKWILALLGDREIPFSFGHLQSGRLTYGHRVHGAGPFSVPDADSWLKIISEQGGVLPDREERAALIRRVGDELAAEKGGEIIWNDALLEEVSGLAEHPEPILGAFDPAYLEIPEEVLLASMQTHQKSFGVRGSDGKLLPYFLTVLNIAPADPELTRAGWEKVLKARLEDARFFWRLDRADSFEHWLRKLEKVIFLAPLGSLADKGRRVERLCAWLARRWTPPADEKLAREAGKLAKADLASGMVGEFDTLQGIMGGIYAARAGVNSQVAEAIAEQYLPAGPDSPCPSSDLGAILSVADRTDTLAGCFLLGKIPTGAADPNGLRRACIGVIRVFLKYNIGVSIRELTTEALNLYKPLKFKKPEAEIVASLEDFFRARLKNYFLGRGYNALTVDAVLAAGCDNLPDCLARLDAITAFAAGENFENSVRVLKRIDNICKNENVADAPDWSDDLLMEDAEKNLAATLRDALPRLDEALGARSYTVALDFLADLRPPLDAFFERVMVMCDDPAIRENRLRLLAALARPFAKIADFSRLRV